MKKIQRCKAALYKLEMDLEQKPGGNTELISLIYQTGI